MKFALLSLSRLSRRRLLSSGAGGSRGGGAGADVKLALLEGALRHVETLGWTDVALAKAATEIGLSPLTHSLASRGAVELVEHFLKKKREHVSKVVLSFKDELCVARERGDEAGEEPAGAQQGRSVLLLTRAIEAHMDFIAPHRQTWSSALALVAAPQNALNTLGAVADLADDLCEFADIQATRSDWYTERCLLLALYGSVELFVLTDSSVGLKESKDYLRRSVEMWDMARKRLKL